MWPPRIRCDIAIERKLFFSVLNEYFLQINTYKWLRRGSCLKIIPQFVEIGHLFVWQTNWSWFVVQLGYFFVILSVICAAHFPLKGNKFSNLLNTKIRFDRWALRPSSEVSQVFELPCCHTDCILTTTLTRSPLVEFLVFCIQKRNLIKGTMFEPKVSAHLSNCEGRLPYEQTEFR